MLCPGESRISQTYEVVLPLAHKLKEVGVLQSPLEFYGVGFEEIETAVGIGETDDRPSIAIAFSRQTSPTSRESTVVRVVSSEACRRLATDLLIAARRMEGEPL